MTHRLTITFSEDAYNTLGQLSEETGKTKAEVLRDALALEDRVQETRKVNGRVLLEEQGQYRELLVR
jgi:predicted DNA-binding protein